MTGIIKGSTKVAMDLDDAKMQKRLKESRAQMARKGVARQAAGKRPRDDDEGLVTDVLGNKRALEEAHRSVIGIGPLHIIQLLDSSFSSSLINNSIIFLYIGM